MKYRIVHEGEDRLRVKCGKRAFSKKEGDIISGYLLDSDFISRVRTNPANGSILIEHDKTRSSDVYALLDLLEPDMLIKEGRYEDFTNEDINADFTDRLTDMVMHRYLRKMFVPRPLRHLNALFKAVRFIVPGISALLSGKVNVDVLDATSIGISLYQRDFSTASSIMFLLRVSDLLEEYTHQKTKMALVRSLAVNVDRVWKVEDGQDTEVSVMDIVPGDFIRVRTGHSVPLDGEIVQGEALVNESSMTGEPLSVRRTVDDSVYASSVVEEGNIVIRVRSLATETRIQSIVSLIDSSEKLKAGIENKATRLADGIVPYSFLLAGAVMALTGNVTKAVSVLMVDYSCAIKLTTPVSIISAMREASDHGIMVKGGKFIEAYANADTIVFDKTGTLTYSEPNLAKVVPLNGKSRKEVLKIAACLEEHFPHSVANAIVKGAHEEGLDHREEHTEVEYVVAHGISSTINGRRAVIGSGHFIFEDEGIELSEENRKIILRESEGYSVVYLAQGDELEGILCIEDPVRQEAIEVIGRLREEGIENIVMLTGDGSAAARNVYETLALDDFVSGVLPEDKADSVKGMRELGRTVIMVGDGVNDSPGLSAADVSVAMGESSDIAREVADISLKGDDLNGLVTMRKLSRRTLDRINSNYRIIVAFNSMLLVLGIAGLIAPATSALLHNGSTMALTGHSMRKYM